MHAATRLGLTGGIGSGKSTVAAIFAARGADVVDADALSRAVTAPGGLAMAPICAAFGEQMRDSLGGLNRAAMRELIMNDAIAKKRLEGIIHPLVGAATEAAVQAAKSQLIVHDIPLLVEGSMWSAKLDYVLVVDCEIATQIARVLARTQSADWSREQIEKTIASQATRQERLRAADIVVYNNALELTDLEEEIWALVDHFGL